MLIFATKKGDYSTAFKNQHYKNVFLVKIQNYVFGHYETPKKTNTKFSKTIFRTDLVTKILILSLQDDFATDQCKLMFSKKYWFKNGF